MKRTKLLPKENNDSTSPKLNTLTVISYVLRILSLYPWKSVGYYRFSEWRTINIRCAINALFWLDFIIFDIIVLIVQYLSKIMIAAARQQSYFFSFCFLYRTVSTVQFIALDVVILSWLIIKGPKIPHSSKCKDLLVLITKYYFVNSMIVKTLIMN